MDEERAGETLGQLPEPVRAGLAGFVAAARQAFADDLAAIVLFGSAAEGRLRPTSDVNLVVVLSRLDPARLEAIGDGYRVAHAAIRLSAMFILETEIAAAGEAFAVKFEDIASRHEVLYGRDPFAALTIPREATLRRVRQVLLNLVLRLREHYALSSSYAEQLAMAAADAVGPLRACAATLLSLETGAATPPREALRRLAQEAGATAALEAMTEARDTGAVPAAGAQATLQGAIDLATQLAARAERLAG
jgi:predicted nucleotidyltransferase